ncbi:hypothetical protein IKF04_02710 [Candidatus Saccharibacteria bacterium]|nr:hypothetical protein [Candidatus Saccharibacteria bacterium]
MLTKEDWRNRTRLYEARRIMKEEFGTYYSPIILAPEDMVARLGLELGDGFATYYEIGSGELDRAIENGDADHIPDLVYNLIGEVGKEGEGAIVVVGTAWAHLNSTAISKIEAHGARYKNI